MRDRGPLGAVLRDGGVEFGVWAPAASRVEVVTLDGPRRERLEDDGGFFSGFVPGLGAGTRYRFRLDGKESYPDPRSDYQPEGPHGPSEVVDRAPFEWTDGGWSGLSADGLVVYELHVGTYTPEGTFSLSAWSLLGGSAVVLGRTRREK